LIEARILVKPAQGSCELYIDRKRREGLRTDLRNKRIALREYAVTGLGGRDRRRQDQAVLFVDLLSLLRIKREVADRPLTVRNAIEKALT